MLLAIARAAEICKNGNRLSNKRSNNDPKKVNISGMLEPLRSVITPFRLLYRIDMSENKDY